MKINEIEDLIVNSIEYNLFNNPNRPDYIKDGCCEYCGKKLGNNPLFVHITVDGTCVPNNLTEELVNLVDQSQGCFPIGSNCAKQIFGKKIKEYTSKS